MLAHPIVLQKGTAFHHSPKGSMIQELMVPFTKHMLENMGPVCECCEEATPEAERCKALLNIDFPTVHQAPEALEICMDANVTVKPTSPQASQAQQLLDSKYIFGKGKTNFYTECKR